jgi:FAD/FMN-containing dehydrogenase
MIDRRPALIARCLGVADVLTGVNFAREHGLNLSIKGGGHNISGLAVCDGGLLLDMSLMRGVWVDPITRTARAQPGCLLGDVDRETQVHGLAAVLGFVSNTGIAGLTLGGGFGYLTRRYGWSCDNVLSMDVVSADGRVVRASEKENRDLFWGLRGGGGNFGVVTSFEYKLHPVGPEAGGDGRRDRVVCAGGSRRARDVPRAHRASPAGAHVRRSAPHGPTGTVAAEECSWPTHRRDLRLP